MLDVVSADARLVAADPAVPGMREVLAPLGLVRRLAPGWGIAGARVAYLRYKPGTSLVAGLLLTDDDGATSFAEAVALGQGAPEKLAKMVLAGGADDVGRGAAVDERAAVGLSDVTADRHLPGVRRVLRGADGDVAPLVYKPGRRWVAREEHASGPDTLVKAHRPETLPGVLAGHQALAGLPVSTVLKVRERHGTVTSPWVDGVPLDRVRAVVPGLWGRAGGVLARIHRQPRLPDLQRPDRAAGLDAAVAAVRAIAPPDLTAVARDVAERVRLGLASGGQVLRVVHGDFSADQVIVRPDLLPDATEVAGADQPEVTVVDLDRVGLDEPVSDLASWYGALVAGGGGEGDPHAVLAPLLEGYAAAGGEADLSRLRLHSAAAVLQRATEPFRRHLPDWPTRVSHLVTTAQDLAT